MLLSMSQVGPVFKALACRSRGHKSKPAAFKPTAGCKNQAML